MRICLRLILTPLLALAAQGFAAVPVVDTARFHQQVRPVLQSHCVECHGPKIQKGKFRVDMLNPDLFTGNDGDRWQDLLDQLNSGDMPPKEAKQKLDRAQREAITGWLQDEIKRAAEFRSGSDGRSTIRRLTRYELNYTLQDLLKVALDHTKNLPDDRAGSDGLRNNASLLGMTPIQFEQISEAAENAVRKALVAPEKPRVLKYHVEPEKGEFQTRDRSSPGRAAGNGFVIEPGQDYVARFPDRPREGKFQIRALVGASTDAGGEAPRLQVWLGFRATGTSYVRKMLTEVSVTASIEHPEVMTFEGLIEEFPMPFEGESPSGDAGKTNHGLMVWVVATDGRGTGNDATKANRKKNGKKNDAKAGKDNPELEPVAGARTPQILLDWVEFEGPYFRSWPPESRVACVGTDALAGQPEDRARAALQSFAARAWRRPVSVAEVEPFVAAFKHQYAAKPNFDAAIAGALALVISSPDFLYLVEPAGEQPRSLHANELASRLSYFLWASLPDDALRQVAESGRLLDKAVLLEQVRRMLADPKTHRLASHFTEQWLGVDQIRSVAVNPEYYPQFHEETKESLEREPAEFFWYVLGHQRSAMDFLDSTYVVVDDTLARHYGLKGVVGQEFRPVKISLEDHRGGVLGMGGFMLAQSDGSRSHAIFRGKWVLTNVLNTPPPPPPPNVPQLDQASPDFAKLPLKQQLAIHRQNQACASCHDKLDPYGLALENFDAIGHWRTAESRLVSAGEVSGKGKKKIAVPAKFESVAVDATALLPDGTPLKGFEDVKAYLLRTKQEVFAEGLARKLLAYSLGRSLIWSDQPEVARLKQSFAASGYKLDVLITEIILSKPFQTK